MRSSDGNWGQKTTLRVIAAANVDGDEVINQVITGQSSDATAVVVSSTSFTQGDFDCHRIRITKYQWNIYRWRNN